jgi:coenzyme F420 hydrogenase subunit beta
MTPILQSTKVSFSNLIKDVIDKGLCIRCGACVSFCAENKIGAIKLSEGVGNLPLYTDQDKCYKCGICYLLCPQTHELNEEMKKEFGWSYPIGHYRNIYAAQAADETIRGLTKSAGVGQAMVLYLLENGVVDAVIVSKRIGLFDSVADIITNRQSLIESETFVPFSSHSPDEINEKHSTYTSVIPFVRMMGAQKNMKLAVLGTPCQIRAIRKMKLLNLYPAENIVFTAGQFCMQSHTFSDLKEKLFVRKYQIDPGDIRDLYFKEDFWLELKSGEILKIPSEDFEDIARSSCVACDHFANDFADISIGGAGAPDGYDTTLVRTDIGERIIQDAVKQGYLHHLKLNQREQAKTESIIENIAEKKKIRAEKAKVSYLCSKCESINTHLNWVMSFVNHELKNMLSSIVINISALADDEIAGRIETSRKKRMMLESLNGLKRMENMIQNYLVSSKINMDSLKLVPAKINIGNELTSQILRNLAPRFEVKGMCFSCEKCDQVEVFGDKSLLYIAISNLITNAVKYGSENTTIYGAVIKRKNGFDFKITNEGMGIPEDKLDSIFDEYTRFDTIGLGGTGLGLYLVKKIAEMHGGSIKVEAGYIINDQLVSYNMLRERSESTIPMGEFRKFATFVLSIPFKGSEKWIGPHPKT